MSRYKACWKANAISELNITIQVTLNGKHRKLEPENVGLVQCKVYIGNYNQMNWVLTTNSNICYP